MGTVDKKSLRHFLNDPNAKIDFSVLPRDMLLACSLLSQAREEKVQIEKRIEQLREVIGDYIENQERTPDVVFLSGK